MRKTAHNPRISAQTGCPHEAALRELSAALRECRYRASAPVTLWADGEPERAWPTERRLVDALVAAERAVGDTDHAHDHVSTS